MTESKPNILYIAHRIPYPPNKGDKIRSFHQIKHLSKNHAIDLVCLADDPNDLRFQTDLKTYCRNVSVWYFSKKLALLYGLKTLLSGKAISAGYFYRKPMQQQIDRWLQTTDYQAVVCFSSSMAEYVFRSRILNPCSENMRIKPCLIMDFCDVDSDKWLQYSRQAKFPFNLIYRMENQLLFKYEKKINRTFDHSIFVSQSEAEIFLRLYPEAEHIQVVLNGADHEYFSPKQSNDASADLNSDIPVLLFTGAMDYHANVDGVLWFSSEIFPLLKEEFPNLQFMIVGSNPHAKVRALSAQSGITVTGFVEDIRPYYSRADVSVIPLRMGRGVQNKVLEAMSMGKPVVTTSKAVEGIRPLNEKHALIEDTPAGFCQAASRLLKNPQLRKQMGENARQFLLEKFDWADNMKHFERLLHSRPDSPLCR